MNVFICGSLYTCDAYFGVTWWWKFELLLTGSFAGKSPWRTLVLISLLVSTLEFYCLKKHKTLMDDYQCTTMDKHDKKHRNLAFKTLYTYSPRPAGMLHWLCWFSALMGCTGPLLMCSQLLSIAIKVISINLEVLRSSPTNFNCHSNSL